MSKFDMKWVVDEIEAWVDYKDTGADMDEVDFDDIEYALEYTDRGKEIFESLSYDDIKAIRSACYDRYLARVAA